MQLGDRPRHRVSGFLKDIEKLENYGNQTGQFLGLSMLFVQSDPNAIKLSPNQLIYNA